MQPYLITTGTHISYRIIQCYLLPGKGDISALTPAEAGTRFSNPRGWIDVGTAVSVQPMPQAAYRSSHHDKHNSPWWDSNLGPLTAQTDALTTRLLCPANLRCCCIVGGDEQLDWSDQCCGWFGVSSLVVRRTDDAGFFRRPTRWAQETQFLHARQEKVNVACGTRAIRCWHANGSSLSVVLYWPGFFSELSLVHSTRTELNLNWSSEHVLPSGSVLVAPLQYEHSHWNTRVQNSHSV